MAKLAFFLFTLLAISFACSATVDSRAIEEDASSSGSLAEENATRIIPREVLFGTPERIGVLISPDGKWISYLTALSGVFNVRISPVDDISYARPITNETTSGVKSYFWAFTNRHIVYSQDTFGDENWHIYAVDITTGMKLDLTPYKNVSAHILSTSRPARCVWSRRMIKSLLDSLSMTISEFVLRSM